MARKPTKAAVAAPTPATPVVPQVQAVLRRLDTIVPYEHNPRDNSKSIDSVAASIKEYGFLVPIVVDGAGVIVAGHTRYAASVKLGLEEVPVITADHLTERQIQAFRLVDNKTAELAVWDFDLLAKEVGELMDSGVDLVPFGWTQSEVDCLHDMVGDNSLADTLPEDGDDKIIDRRDAGGGDGVNSAAQTNRGGNVISNDPKSVRVAVGEINFFVDIELYRDWAHEVRKNNGFDMARVIQDLAGRLGIEAKPMTRNARQSADEEAAMELAKLREQDDTGKTAVQVRERAAIDKRRPRTRSAESTLRKAVDAEQA